MIVLSWNCRGLGNRSAVEVLAVLVRKKGPTILFLMETELTVREMEPIKTELGFASMLAVPSDGRRGGLAMLWKTDVMIDTQTYSPHHIDVQVLMPSTQPWRLTGFYGYSEEQLKPETWRLMRHLYNRSTLPWLCVGDYNEILVSEEKNGRHPRPLPPMLAFRNTLLACGLIYLGYHGYRYSWRNGCEGEDFVEERLDRAYASLGWSEIYPAAKVHPLTMSYSDHDPILITTSPQNVQHNRRPPIRREMGGPPGV